MYILVLSWMILLLLFGATGFFVTQLAKSHGNGKRPVDAGKGTQKNTTQFSYL